MWFVLPSHSVVRHLGWCHAGRQYKTIQYNTWLKVAECKNNAMQGCNAAFFAWGALEMHCGSIRSVGSVAWNVQLFRQRRIRRPIESCLLRPLFVCCCLLVSLCYVKVPVINNSSSRLYQPASTNRLISFRKGRPVTHIKASWTLFFWSCLWLVDMLKW